MKSNLKKQLLNTIGVAFVAMLLGSNVGYALDNYGILKHNLSYAMFSDTETGTDEEKYVGGSGTYKSPGTEFVRDGEPIMEVNKCPLNQYQRFATEAYKTIEETFSQSISKGTAINVGGKMYTFHELGINYDSKKDKTVSGSYTVRNPECEQNDYNCCLKGHLKSPSLCNVLWSLSNRD